MLVISLIEKAWYSSPQGSGNCYRGGKTGDITIYSVHIVTHSFSIIQKSLLKAIKFEARKTITAKG